MGRTTKPSRDDASEVERVDLVSGPNRPQRAGCERESSSASRCFNFRCHRGGCPFRCIVTAEPVVTKFEVLRVWQPGRLRATVPTRSEYENHLQIRADFFEGHPPTTVLCV
jgi:hypothetical protein